MFLCTASPEELPAYDSEKKPLSVIDSHVLSYQAAVNELTAIRAPLYLCGHKASIIEDFNVNISDSKGNSVVSLKTEGYKRLDSRIHLSGSLDRTAEVRLETLDGKIVTHFPTKEGDQAVRLIAKSMHGKVNVALPEGFDGIVVLETFTGHIRLSKAFKARATLIPNLKASPFYLKTYRIRPNAQEASSIVEKHAGSKARSLDACHIKTIHGCIRLSYASEGSISRSRRASKQILGCPIS